MKKTKQLLFVALLPLVLLSSCAGTQQNEKNIVTVSILPQQYFLEALAGNTLEINLLVPPGASPHAYEPTPKQMKDLERSGLYLTIGHLGFEEAWIPRIESNYPDLKIINTSTGIPLIVDEHVEGEVHEGDHHHHGTDPHIWMSPKQTVIMIQNMASALIRHDNACEDLIKKNLDSLLGVVNQLDSLFETELRGLQNRKFIIFHPALTYLARDYGLEQISMEFQGKEPSPAHFKRIVDRARAENIKLLFIQKEFDIENAKQMAKEIGADLLQIDPLAENWHEQMMDILYKLKSADASQTE